MSETDDVAVDERRSYDLARITGRGRELVQQLGLVAWSDIVYIVYYGAHFVQEFVDTVDRDLSCSKGLISGCRSKRK